MSNKYKHGDTVPTGILTRRLRELVKAVTAGRESVAREFVMRIPAELDHCPDLIMSEAASRLEALEQRVKELEAELILTTLHRDELLEENRFFVEKYAIPLELGDSKRGPQEPASEHKGP